MPFRITVTCRYCYPNPDALNSSGLGYLTESRGLERSPDRIQLAKQFLDIRGYKNLRAFSVCGARSPWQSNTVFGHVSDLD